MIRSYHNYIRIRQPRQFPLFCFSVKALFVFPKEGVEKWGLEG